MECRYQGYVYDTCAKRSFLLRIREREIYVRIVVHGECFCMFVVPW